MAAKTLIVISLLFYTSFWLTAQNYIGKSKEEVRKLMSEYQKKLVEDETAKNTIYDMIKYSDRSDNQTVIFVFNDGLCSYSKRMCDYSLLKEITRQLDAANTRANDTIWYYQAEGAEYIISLKKEKWFFIIDTRKLEE